ncbi:beta-1,4-glucuronyltransferase 1 [Chelonoidis abingdonii]|uniref:Beta-1,4-glucuronyltransferase 1 n=1 Tax=Chelonoidis abingdonii TaxID=106734 RepID=A0A8C0IXB9_CHEAB|nr:beta-1,4-glucuronyltransferase 1 [Chelonoidis abingdonii]
MQGPARCSFFKALLWALALVALLQLLYLSLLSGLHGRQQRSRYSELFGGRRGEAPGRPSEQQKEQLKRALASGGRLDASGQYRIYTDMLGPPERAGRAPDLVLATHTSLSNLHQLQELLGRWQGPVSVALFAPGPAEVRLATLMLYALGALCGPVRQLVSAHLVCHSGDLAAFPELEDRAEFARLKACGDVFAKLARAGAGRRNYALGANASYPNNLLRNVARGAATGHYTLVLDVDMLPSEGLREAFLALAATLGAEGPPGVFVVPAFEIRHTRRLPGAKAELLQLYQVGEIRPFYEELCPRCQAPTNYSRWLNLPLGSSLNIAYTVEWRDPWEPFYISAISVPPYDERFKQYGFNRISQACELHVAGYSFSVLNNAFLVHKGFKVPSEFHAQKDAENQRNKVLFRQFKQELKLKYPGSPRRC